MTNLSRLTVFLGLSMALGLNACAAPEEAAELPTADPALAPTMEVISQPTTPIEIVPDAPPMELGSLGEGEVVTASGLRILDVTVGDGAEAVAGSTVSVHYTGTFMDGSPFDSSLDRGEPIEFQIGTPGIIAGWNEGIAGMKVGGKRKLGIPADLAYGAAGRDGIPPNTPLLFDVELMGVN